MFLCVYVLMILYFIAVNKKMLQSMRERYLTGLSSHCSLIVVIINS